VSKRANPGPEGSKAEGKPPPSSSRGARVKAPLEANGFKPMSFYLEKTIKLRINRGVREPLAIDGVFKGYNEYGIFLNDGNKERFFTWGHIEEIALGPVTRPFEPLAALLTPK